MDMDPGHFFSENPHFCRSALSRFSQWDIQELLSLGGIVLEERDHGRLFSTGDASAIVDFLVSRCREAGAALKTGQTVEGVEVLEGANERYLVHTREAAFSAISVVVASGGAARPALGGSVFGYDLARSFGIDVVPPRPALSPLLWSREDKRKYGSLSGISLEVRLSVSGRFGSYTYDDALLFTHTGISGPAALQASCRWAEGSVIEVDLLPGGAVESVLERRKKSSPKAKIRTVLASLLPARLVDVLFAGDTDASDAAALNGVLAHLDRGKAEEIAERVHHWRIVPASTAGYTSAEVTGGGVSVFAVSSRTFEAVKVPGLYFIGEVLDVTGELGGYNLQWAWASGYCAGLFA
jgi:predicted Rossmann fold flavoprotein